MQNLNYLNFKIKKINEYVTIDLILWLQIFTSKELNRNFWLVRDEQSWGCIDSRLYTSCFCLLLTGSIFSLCPPFTSTIYAKQKYHCWIRLYTTMVVIIIIKMLLVSTIVPWAILEGAKYPWHRFNCRKWW